MIFAVFFAILFTSALAHQHSEDEIIKAESTGKIGPSLMRDLKSNPNEKFSYFISFVNGDTSEVLKKIKDSFTPETTHGDKAEEVHSGLNKHADHHQTSCRKFLKRYESFTSGVQSFWISNVIYVKESPAFLILKLANKKYVDNIEKEGTVRASDGLDQGKVFFESLATNISWGVEKIGAPLVWNNGLNGSGTIVSTIDTGVRGTHETLNGSYVGSQNNGWFDATGTCPTSIISNNPCDDQGHGTHTMGTILGINGFGVAPGAKWISCKALAGILGIGSDSWILSCMQFILCPTKPNGSGADCQKAPHIVSNSWGSNAQNASKPFEDGIGAWVTAGIVPIFAAGNSGPNCETMGYPGWSPKVISVGATDEQDAIASFSSVGPGFNKTYPQKPEISAPGTNIVSAWYTSDTANNTLSGTSMACPHAAGLAALILQKNRTLGVAGVRKKLEDTATRNVKTQNKKCGDISDTTFPNYFFGYGRIDAVNATTFST